MGKSAEFYAQAEDCKRWAEKAKTVDAKARWLDLAGKWLRLAEESGREPEGVKLVIYERGADREA